jgi:NitT/TauT family transport system ATP-binding protein
MIEFRNIKKTFVIDRGKGESSDVHALEDISFSAVAGSFVAIVGPSGCGKSTLLEIAAGIQNPDGGEVLVGGVTTHAAAGAQRKNSAFLPKFSNGFWNDDPGKVTAMVFQDFVVFPWMTVKENILFVLKRKGITGSDAEHAATEALAGAGLLQNSRDFPLHLSGGMVQRLGLARALAVKPKILLLDEPFASVDAITRASLQTTLGDLWQRHGITILMVTHDIEEAVFLSDRVIVLSPGPGRVIADISLDMARPRERSSRETVKWKTLIGDILRK